MGRKCKVGLCVVRDCDWREMSTMGSPAISGNEEESDTDFEDANANQEEDSVSLADDAAVLAALRPAVLAPAPVVQKKPEFEGKAKLRKRKAEQDKKDHAAALARANDVTTPTPASPIAQSTLETATPEFDHSRTSTTETSLRTGANYQAPNGNPWGDEQPPHSSSSNGPSPNGTPDDGEAADSLSPLHDDPNHSFDANPSSSSLSASSKKSSKKSTNSSLTSHSHSNILNNSLPTDGEQSIAKIWRSSDSSQHSMHNISLNDDDETQSFDENVSESEVGAEEELDDDEDVKKNRRKTVTPTSASMSGQSYDFLLQRLEAQSVFRILPSSYRRLIVQPLIVPSLQQKLATRNGSESKTSFHARKHQNSSKL